MNYKQQLQDELRTQYRKTKTEFKQVTEALIDAKEKRTQERKRDLAADILNIAKRIANE